METGDVRCVFVRPYGYGYDADYQCDVPRNGGRVAYGYADVHILNPITLLKRGSRPLQEMSVNSASARHMLRTPISRSHPSKNRNELFNKLVSYLNS